MGNASYRQTTGIQSNLAAQDLRNFFQADLPKFICQQKIGNGKFMKTYVMRVDSSPLIVKVYLKLPDEDLQFEIMNLTILWKTLKPTKYPNLLPYQLWLNSTTGTRYTSYTNPSPAYLIRQYFHSNLYDRFSTRPFLDDLEKLWLMFQLFKCLEICHEHGIVHGDLKPENVMCTTAGWVILTDFSPFKPTLIPDDDPTDYQYYFDCMGRHRCYVAPERFVPRSTGTRSSTATTGAATSGRLGRNQRKYTSGSDYRAAIISTREIDASASAAGGTGASRRFSAFVGGDVGAAANNASKLLPSMDVFSLGCVMAEVFLDGVPFMDLPAMLQYVSSSNAPTSSSSSGNSITGVIGVQSDSELESSSARPPTAVDFAATIAQSEGQPGALLPPPPSTAPPASTPKAPSIIRITRLDQDGSPVKSLLSRVVDPLIRRVIVDMTHRDPAQRLSVSEYLDILQGRGGLESDLGLPPLQHPTAADDNDATASSGSSRGGGEGVGSFPPYFNSCLYPLFLKMHWNGVTPDDRVNLICQNYGEIFSSIAGYSDVAGVTYFTHGAAMRSSQWQLHASAPSSSTASTAEQRDALTVLKGAASTSSGCIGTVDGSHVGSKVVYARPSKFASADDALEVSDEIVQQARVRIGNESATAGAAESTPLSCACDCLLTATTTRDRSSGATATAQLETAQLMKLAQQLLADISSADEQLTSKSNDELQMRAAGLAAASAQVAVSTSANDDSISSSSIKRVAAVQRSSDEHILGSPVVEIDNGRAAGLFDPTTATSAVDAVAEQQRYKQPKQQHRAMKERKVFLGFVLIVNILCSNFRHLKYPQSKIVCIMLLTRLGAHCSDSVVLQRIAPLLLLGMEDQCSTVRAMAIRALRTALSVVHSFAGMECNFFPMYAFPALSRTAKDPEISVRVAFAESIGTFAQTAKRFLDIHHLQAVRKAVGGTALDATPTATANANANAETAAAAARSRLLNGTAEVQAEAPVLGTTTPRSANANSFPNATVITFPYDTKLDALKEQVSRWIRELIVDSSASLASSSSGAALGARTAYSNASNISSSNSSGSSSSVVKRVILLDIMRLCTFFGQEATMDRLLTQLLTFLNDQDWELRHAFCAKIPSVCAFLGATVTSECILPCIENAIYDVEEKVVLCAVHSLVLLIELKLLSNFFIVDFARKLKCLLLHPSRSLREGAVEYLGAAAAALGSVDSAVFLLPEIRDALRIDVSGLQLSAQLLRHALRAPLERAVYRGALFQRLTDLAQLYSGGGIDAATAASADSKRLLLSDSDVAENREAQSAESIAEKLRVVESYINLAAREINTKTMQWRNGIASSQTQQHNALILGSSSSSLRATATTAAATGGRGKATASSAGAGGGGQYNVVPIQSLRSGILSVKEAVAQSDPLQSLLDWTTQPTLEHSVQILMVPHQKYGVPSLRPLPDDVWQQSVYMDGDGARNSSKLRLLFGLSSRQGDGSRTLTAAANGGLTGAESLMDVSQSTASINANASSASGSSGQFASTTTTASSSNLLSEGGVANASGSGGFFGGADGKSSMLVLKTVSPAYSESIALLRRIKALDIPPVPPFTGSLVQPTPDSRTYSIYSDNLDTSSSFDYNFNTRSSWRPKEGVLLTTLREHRAAVNRLMVSPDQSYFASASADGTVKVWQTRNIERTAFPRSAVTYDLHNAEVLDLTPIENSHSVASVATDGRVHVWRVDVATTAASAAAAGAQLSDSAATATSAVGDEDAGARGQPSGLLGVRGTSQIRSINPMEGAAVCVHHFNSDVCSMVTYATQRGGVHGWDLRAAREAMRLPLRPELGQITSMTLSPDRHWICAGTSEGFISLWDIRYNVQCKLWRHSSSAPIHRLACCRSPRPTGGADAHSSAFHNTGFMPQTEGAYLFVAAGNNETAVWGIPEGGECFKCFRTVPLETSRGPAAPLPVLREISLPRHPFAPIRVNRLLPQQSQLGATSGTAASQLRAIGSIGGIGPASASASVLASAAVYLDGGSIPSAHSVRAIIGRISQSNLSYLVTAGTDRAIRFWDFSAPTKCYTVSGLEAAQPKGIFDAPKLNDGSMGKLFVCYVASTPSSEKILQAHLPLREGRGIAAASSSARDAILDVKNIDLPMRLLLSGSRDGEVKLWR